MAKKVYEEENIRAIADKIREKTGSNDTYKTSQMANGVEEVYEAGQKAEYDRFWDAFQENGKRDDYQHAFCKGWKTEMFKPKYNIYGDTIGLFSRARGLYVDVIKVLKEQGITLDTSQSESLSGFANGSDIYTLPTISFEGLNIYDELCANYTFAFTPYLHTIEKLIVKSGITYNKTFRSAEGLKNIVIEGIIDNDIDFSYSPLLTHDSLMSIINGLKDLTTKVYKTYDTLELYFPMYVPETNYLYPIDRSKGDTVSGYYKNDAGVYGNILISLSPETYYGIEVSIASSSLTSEEQLKIINDTVAFMVDDENHITLVFKEEPTETRTLTLGETNLAKLTDAEKTIATNKGWILA